MILPAGLRQLTNLMAISGRTESLFCYPADEPSTTNLLVLLAMGFQGRFGLTRNVKCQLSIKTLVSCQRYHLSGPRWLRQRAGLQQEPI